MSVKKDLKTGLWTLQYYFKDWKGDRKHSVKRGFKSKHDAEAWLVEFRIKETGKFSRACAEDVGRPVRGGGGHSLQYRTLP